MTAYFVSTQIFLIIKEMSTRSVLYLYESIINRNEEQVIAYQLSFSLLNVFVDGISQKLLLGSI